MRLGSLDYLLVDERIRILAGNRGNPATGRFPSPVWFDEQSERIAGLIDCHRIALDFGADAARRALVRVAAPSSRRDSGRQPELADRLLQGR